MGSFIVKGASPTRSGKKTNSSLARKERRLKDRIEKRRIKKTIR